MARRAAPEDRRKIQRIAPTGIVSRKPVNIDSLRHWPEEKGESCDKKKLGQHRMKIDTCARNASTDPEELDWDAATTLQLQDTVEATSQKNAQYL